MAESAPFFLWATGGVRSPGLNAHARDATRRASSRSTGSPPIHLNAHTVGAPAVGPVRTYLRFALAFRGNLFRWTAYTVLHTVTRYHRRGNDMTEHDDDKIPDTQRHPETPGPVLRDMLVWEPPRHWKTPDPALFTEAQADGRACVLCGDDRVLVPAGRFNDCQIFICDKRCPSRRLAFSRLRSAIASHHPRAARELFPVLLASASRELRELEPGPDARRVRAFAQVLLSGCVHVHGAEELAARLRPETPADPAFCHHRAMIAPTFEDAECLDCGATFTRANPSPRSEACEGCGASTCVCGCGQCVNNCGPTDADMVSR